MFTSLERPKKVPMKPRPPGKPDILLPGLDSGHYQHNAREPNTNYEVQLMHYNQKKDAELERVMKAAATAFAQEASILNNQKKVDQSHFKRMVKEKIEKKIEDYENAVEERRNRLRQLFCIEEKQFYYETVDRAQKGNETKMEDMKKRAEILRAAKEAERQEIVRQKRMQQFKARSQEIRPYLEKKNIIESKNAQLQQMRENEARREAEKEASKMWDHLMMRESEAKAERERQEAIMRKRQQMGLMEVWEKQLRGKELLKQEVAKVAEEDRAEMIKLEAELKRQQLEAENSKLRKKEQVAKELLEQINVQREFVEKRRREEKALTDALIKLGEMEIQKEKNAFKDYTSQAKRESFMYRKHLQELAEARKKEENELQNLLDRYQQEVQRKQDEAKCKVVEAKRKLQESVLEERAEQVRLKKEREAQRQKDKQAEDEVMRMAFVRNKCLQEEHERLEKEAVKQYATDLQTQIDYNSMLRQKEQDELQRQLANAQEEEEYYNKLVEQVNAGMFTLGSKHPFRVVLERYDCQCPPQN